MGRKSVWLLFGPLLTILLAACRITGDLPPDQEMKPGFEENFTSELDLPDRGPAPELHNDVWLNVDQPFRLSDLHGKVVLLDFWTFG